MRDELDLPVPERAEAERTAVEMVRELGLSKGDVIRRLAAASRPVTLDEIEVSRRTPERKDPDEVPPVRRKAPRTSA